MYSGSTLNAAFSYGEGILLARLCCRTALARSTLIPFIARLPLEGIGVEACEERFYVKGLDIESHGELRAGAYQELARGFGVKEYQPRLQGHSVFEFNTNESQCLRRLGRQPAARRCNVGRTRPPQQPNGGMTSRRHNVGEIA